MRRGYVAPLPSSASSGSPGSRPSVMSCFVWHAPTRSPMQDRASWCGSWICRKSGFVSFDLLFEGLEITTGGQRLHRRSDLEAALRARGIDPASFEDHLRMFELGMPPHGGLAIGL